MPPIGEMIKGTLSSVFGSDKDPEVVATPASGTGAVDYRPLIQAQIDRLKNDRGDKADMFLAFASGLGRPTKTGSFGESIGYATEALAKQSAESAKARDARRDMLLKYGIDLATLDAEEQKNLLAAQVKTAAAPRAVTEADIAKFGKTISAATHYIVDGKPVLIPAAEGDASRMTAAELTEWGLDPTGIYVKKNGVPVPVREGRGLNPDQTQRMGYAKRINPGLTEQEILDRNLLYSDAVDNVMTRIYGQKVGMAAGASAAAREPYEDAPPSPTVTARKPVVGADGKTTTYYQIKGLWYDNPEGK